MRRAAWASIAAAAVAGTVLGSLAFGGRIHGIADRVIAPALDRISEIDPGRPPAGPGTDDPGCALPVAGTQSREFVASGFPVSGLRMDTLGRVRVPVIFVDFAGSRAASAAPDAEWEELRPAQSFLRRSSYGRMRLTLDPLPRWIHLGRSAADFGISRAQEPTAQQLAAYVQRVVSKADRHVDFTGVTGVLVVANREATAIDYSPALILGSGDEPIQTDEGAIASAATLGSDTWTTWGWRIVPHELGHAMGLPDLYDDDYRRMERMHRHVGTWDLMGDPLSATPEYLAWNRWQLGWLGTRQVACLPLGTDTRTSLLSPVTRPGGTKALVARVSPTRAVVVESRRSEGYDASRLRSGARIAEGALVYVVDSSVATLDGPIRVVSGSRRDHRLASAPLGRGESVVVDGVRIEVLRSGDAGDRVRVTRV